VKISVITLCLNGADHLGEALQSVADQDYTELEHLVIDGGSTDGSLEIIRSFADEHPTLRWWSEPDKGISDAMNRGIGFATGELVAFLHSDDCYAGPTVLSEVIESLKANPDAVWLTAGIREIGADGQLLRELPVRRYSARRLLRNNILFHPATFVLKETLEAVGGFDNSLRFAMDYDLWLRLARVFPPLVLDRIVTSFRVHLGSRSSSQSMKALEEEYLIRMHYLSGCFSRLWHRIYQVLRRALNPQGFR